MNEMNEPKAKNVAVLLFDNFETLDVFGPVEVLGYKNNLFDIKFYSLSGGVVINSHGIHILTEKLSDLYCGTDIFLIPGGAGTRTEINNSILIEEIKRISLLSNYVLTVCTGSGLLAKTGLLDNREATSNKRAFSWVKSISSKVIWNSKARWCKSDKFYTSSGVSAGIDMSFDFISDIYGNSVAEDIAKCIEYNRIYDKENDTFIADSAFT